MQRLISAMYRQLDRLIEAESDNAMLCQQNGLTEDALRHATLASELAKLNHSTTEKGA